MFFSETLQDTGKAIMWGRTHDYATYTNTPFYGYGLQIQSTGQWALIPENGKALARGTIPGFIEKWHHAELVFDNNCIEVKIDRLITTTVSDSTYNKGAMALGTGWNEAYFDNIIIEPVNN